VTKQKSFITFIAGGLRQADHLWQDDAAAAGKAISGLPGKLPRLCPNFPFPKRPNLLLKKCHSNFKSNLTNFANKTVYQT
jgi:hypothetical protein